MGHPWAVGAFLGIVIFADMIRALAFSNRDDWGLRGDEERGGELRRGSFSSFHGNFRCKPQRWCPPAFLFFFLRPDLRFSGNGKIKGGARVRREGRPTPKEDPSDPPSPCSGSALPDWFVAPLGATFELSGVRLSSPDLIPLIGTRSGLPNPSSGLHKVRISRPLLWSTQGSNSQPHLWSCPLPGSPGLSIRFAICLRLRTLLVTWNSTSM
ncbi:hypothetical protein U1Q18_012365 [Sarracenia purpurea var. burkii]